MKSFISSQFIKAEAQSLGFHICGIALAKPIDIKTQYNFKQWLSTNKCADMNYLKEHTDKRCDPNLLIPGAKSIISVALNYYPSKFIPDNQYQIAWYAYGKDYHYIIRKKLELLLEKLQKHYPDITGKAFCDTAPILEKYWAVQAGLGWIGKNTQLIIPHFGSYCFLGELIIDITADHYDTPLPDRCGKCTRCLNNCPTKAIEAPYQLNSNSCISYLTIENKNDIPPLYVSKINNNIYGCNICQSVCPWNRFAKPCTELQLQPSDELLNMRNIDWENLSDEKYRNLFKDSAIKRAKYKGLMRNIRFVSKNTEKK